MRIINESNDQCKKKKGENILIPEQQHDLAIPPLKPNDLASLPRYLHPRDPPNPDVPLSGSGRGLEPHLSSPRGTLLAFTITGQISYEPDWAAVRCQEARKQGQVERNGQQGCQTLSRNLLMLSHIRARYTQSRMQTP